MLFSYSTLALAAAASSVVSAASLVERYTSDQSFQVLTIRSGSNLQYASVGASNGVVTVGEKGATFNIKEDKLYLDGTSDIVYVDAASRQVKYSSAPPSDAITESWTLADYLELDGKASGVACPSGSSYTLYWASDTQYDFCDGKGLGVGTRYILDSSSKSTSTSTSTSSAAVAVSTVAAKNYFDVVAIHSGTPIQYLGFSTKGDGFIYFGSDALLENYIEDGHLKVQGTDSTVWIDADTNALHYNTQIPSNAKVGTWSVEDGSLKLDGQSNAVACGNDYKIYWSTDGSDSVCKGDAAIGADLLVTYVSESESAATKTASTSTKLASTFSTEIRSSTPAAVIKPRQW
ncbi:uncharacterized protein V2V93DRAFT_360869 [Kockiozyma suomiensis]|uniref:uncharacterized protein n=1 Tax=Kockiozyma suomiensis TaxID=1337062 RepID=UPI003343123A